MKWERPIKEARSEVEKCAWVMDYFADNGKVFTTDEVVNTDARRSFVTFEPLGCNRKYNAMEFSLLASIKICSSFVDGWECNRPKTSKRDYADVELKLKRSFEN